MATNWKDPEAVKAYKRARYYATLDTSKARYLANRAQRIASTRAWVAARPGYAREWFLRTSYGISAADFDAMLARQDGRCAICRTKRPKGLRRVFQVDHCHKTGRVRGALCQRCNTSFLPLVERHLERLLAHLGLPS